MSDRLKLLDLELELKVASTPPKGDGCFSCRYLTRGTESWEMPHIWWYECDARPANGSLRGFPWRSTKCKLRVPRGARDV